MAFMWIATACAIIGFVNSAVLPNTTAAVTTCAWEDCDQTCGIGNRLCQRSDGKKWNIDCHVQDCAPMTGCGNADIVFVIDSSGSIGEKNWWKTKQFVIDVSKGLNISPTESRVALVIYSNKARTMWKLDAYNSMAELEEKIWEIEYISGNTNTYEGLLFAQQLIDETARPDFKHMVIVITDGKSNNQHNYTVHQAEAMHKQGTEIFAVGISGDVDTDEIEGIASKPTLGHAFYAGGYDALRNITNVIINGTCEAAKEFECDPWSDWTACKFLGTSLSCGVGISSRIRKCNFYHGITTDTRFHTETKKCEVLCKPDCSRCVYSLAGMGYLPHENCHKFIQCQRTDDNTFMEHERDCPPTLFWRQSIEGCDRIHDKDYTCTDGPIATTTTAIPTTAPACDKDAHATIAAKFIWHTATGDHTMDCPYGTVFRKARCQCLTGGNNKNDCKHDGTVVEFPFNTDIHDICRRADGVAFGNVTLDDGAAYFDGSSRVEVSFFDNWFAENHVTELTVSLWFRYMGNNDDYRGLFSNGDCVEDASVLLAIGEDQAQGRIRAESTAEFSSGGGSTVMSFVREQWTHVMIVKSWPEAKYYVNGVLLETLSAGGRIKNTQCAANIGVSHKGEDNHFFQGYIDDVRVYKKVEWGHADKLYKAGRQ